MSMLFLQDPLASSFFRQQLPFPSTTEVTLSVFRYESYQLLLPLCAHSLKLVFFPNNSGFVFSKPYWRQRKSWELGCWVSTRFPLSRKQSCCKSKVTWPLLTKKCRMAKWGWGREISAFWYSVVNIQLKSLISREIPC